MYTFSNQKRTRQINDFDKNKRMNRIQKKASQSFD